MSKNPIDKAYRSLEYGLYDRKVEAGAMGNKTICKVSDLIIVLVLLCLAGVSIVPTMALAEEIEDSLSLNSESAILIDSATGTLLFDKESDRLMYPASITKIVTGIIAIEEGNLDDIVTVSEAARNVDGTRVYLLEGEQVPLLKLVQGLLINSGNDAATAIAEYFDGSESRFADRMNEFVKDKIGTNNTTFRNPHGLFDEEHRTTAYDMALITRYAMQNPLFRSIVGTKQMEWVGEGWETTLYNHNLLLWRYEGTTGVKNGYVNESGNTLVASVKRGDSEWIAVTLKAGSAELAYSDMITMFDYGFEHFQTHWVTVNPAEFAAYQDRFVLPDHLVFTSEIGEPFDIGIEETKGQIVVKSQGGTNLYSEDLEVIVQQEQVEPIPENVAFSAIEGKAISSRISTGSTFILMIFLMFIFLYMRKRLKRKNHL